MASTDPPYYGLDLDTLSPDARAAALREYHALAYEIEMLGETAALAVEHWKDERLRKVLIESYALHFRNLAEFLWGKFDTGWAPRVKSRHYRYEDSPWKPLTKPIGSLALVTQASQQIAHLTTARLSDPDDARKRWVLQTGLDLLRDGLVTFMTRADRSKFSQYVEPALDEFRRTLSTPAILTGLAYCVGSTHISSRLGVWRSSSP